MEYPHAVKGQYAYDRRALTDISPGLRMLLTLPDCGCGLVLALATERARDELVLQRALPHNACSSNNKSPCFRC